MIVEYARRGCESVQLHTFFQLPLSEYPATHGSRTQRALHALLFDPRDGLVAALLALEAAGGAQRRHGRFGLPPPPGGAAPPGLAVSRDAFLLCARPYLRAAG